MSIIIPRHSSRVFTVNVFPTAGEFRSAGDFNSSPLEELHKLRLRSHVRKSTCNGILRKMEEYDRKPLSAEIGL